MATVTLTADTNYSALTLANDDTIDLDGFLLTLDIQPTQTGVQVTSPGTNGRVTFSGPWVLPTWDFFAGASTPAGMINTLPSGAEIGSITGGTAVNSWGIPTNNGTVSTVNSGTGSNSVGIVTNNGTVTTANAANAVAAVVTNNGTVTTANGGNQSNSIGVGVNNGTVTTANAGSGSASFGVSTNGVTGVVVTSNGGSGTSAFGVNTNNGTVTTANGGTGNNAAGVVTNNGTVTTATGGSNASAHGVNTNNGTVTVANGGNVANAFGILVNNGQCLRLTDNVVPGVSIWRGVIAFVEGPFINGVIPSNIKTIYSLGELSENATIANDATVITLSEGTGSAGFSGIRGISRRLGT